LFGLGEFGGVGTGQPRHDRLDNERVQFGAVAGHLVAALAEVDQPAV